MLHHTIGELLKTNCSTHCKRLGLEYQLLDTLIEDFRANDLVELRQTGMEKKWRQHIIGYINTHYQQQVNLGKLAETLYAVMPTAATGTAYLPIPIRAL